VDFADFSDGIGRPRQTGYYVPRSEYELVCSFRAMLLHFTALYNTAYMTFGAV